MEPTHLDDTICAYFRVVGIITAILAASTAYLIWTRTSKHSRVYRYYLLFILASTTLVDLSLSEAIRPFFIFPYYAGYTRGLLNLIPLNAHTQIAIYFGLLSLMGISYLFSFIYRHQVVLPENSPFKIRKVALVLLHVALVLSVLIPTLVYIFAWPCYVIEKDQLQDLYPELLWITNRSEVWTVDRTDGSFVFLMFIFYVPMVISICSILAIGLAVHLFYVLHSQCDYMSTKTREFHRRMTVALMYQTVIPGTFILVPIAVFFAFIVTGFEWFEVVWLTTALQSIHAVTTCVVVVAMTPSYRAALCCRGSGILHVSEVSIITSTNGKIGNKNKNQ